MCPSCDMSYICQQNKSLLIKGLFSAFLAHVFLDSALTYQVLRWTGLSIYFFKKPSYKNENNYS